VIAPGVILLLCMTMLLGTSQAGGTATFRVHDHLDPNEIEETTSLYIDRTLVRTIHLDGAHRDETVVVTVPEAANPAYALCGTVTIRRPGGDAETHEVDGSGSLAEVAERDFEAVAAEDFSVFYLVDVTAGRPPTPVRVNRARSCAQALS
jgi:hypothetical protein